MTWTNNRSAAAEIHEALDNKGIGGDGGIRTLDRPLQAYNGLANRRLQPLGHVSSKADMPEVRLSRKRQIARFVQNHSTPIDRVALAADIERAPSTSLRPFTVPSVEPVRIDLDPKNLPFPCIGHMPQRRHTAGIAPNIECRWRYLGDAGISPKRF
jgi:hypothetical protein